MSKQDGYASRTAADLERKYNFGKTFSEVYGLVSDARKIAEDAQNAYEGLTQNEIFNLLTDFGKSQGVYRDDTGNVYVNASYLKGGKIAAELIDVQSLKVSGNLATQDDIPDTSGFATMDDIPDISGFIKNDLSDPAFANKTGITQIMGGVITTDFLKTLGIFSEVAYINGKLTVGQLPDEAAKKEDIPDTSGFATTDDIPDTSKFIVNDVPDSTLIEYSKMTGLTEIMGGVITTEWLKTKGIFADVAFINGTLSASKIVGGELDFDKITVKNLTIGGGLPSNLATTDDIPDTSGFIVNDCNDYWLAQQTGITTIVGGLIETYEIRATYLKGKTVQFLDYWDTPVGGIDIIDTSSGNGLDIYTNYSQGGIRISANGGNLYLSSGHNPFMLLGRDSASNKNVVSFDGGALLIPTDAYGGSLPATGTDRQIFFLLS